MEPRVSGHWLYYVGLLVAAAADRGFHPVVALADEAPTSSEFNVFLAALTDQMELVQLTSLPSISDIEQLARLSEAVWTVLPSADRWLLPLASQRGWHGPGELCLLIMRFGFQRDGRLVRSALVAAVKRAAILVLLVSPRVRIRILRAATDRSRHVLRSAHDPVTDASTTAAIERLRARWGMDGSRRWFGVFGAITPRKNVELVLRAALSDGAERIGIVVAGRFDPDYLVSLRDLAKEATEGGVAVVIEDAMLDEDEIDSAVRAVHAVVVAHSNEGPSGLLAKAAGHGTFVLAAGAQSLRRDAAAIGELGLWVPLTVADLRRGVAALLDRVPSGGVLGFGTGRFTSALLPPNGRAATLPDS